MDLDGSFSPNHYWWLAFEWSNLLASCCLCDSAKAQRFPVLRPRATMGSRGTKLGAERPLLLDPCKDNPEANLIFDREGLPEARPRVYEDVLLRAGAFHEALLAANAQTVARHETILLLHKTGRAEYSLAGRKALAVYKKAIERQGTLFG